MADLHHAPEISATVAVQAPIAQKPRVFRLNDYEWWAGLDLESIRTAYHQETGIDPDGPEGFDDPHELSETEMLKTQYHYDEYDLTLKRSFREQLDLMFINGQTFPCFFAGTEC